jgi:hypothetical protein
MHNINLFSTKMTATAGLSMATLFLLAPMAFATNPHFVGKPSCEVTNSGALECTGKIAGLGSATEVEAFLEADVPCKNRGGNIPQGLTIGPEETLTVHSGQTVFDLIIPDPCPDGMTATFANVAVFVDDIRLPIPGTFT